MDMHFSLKGQTIDLVPLDISHSDDLKEAVKDGELFNHWYTFIPKPGDMDSEINRRLKLFEEKSMIPFAVIDKKTQKAIGMTTFMNLNLANKKTEIGSTWYRQNVQKTAVNIEAKILLLTHAFEVFECIAVEFRTHFINFQSRKAIEALGAKLDGILRNDRIMPDGSLRDTCVYSILNHEWPTVKNHLNYRLKKRLSHS